MHILGVFWYVYGLRIIHSYCYNVLMKCVMLSLNVHYSVTNVLLLPLMSENAPYTGLYIGPLLNVFPGGLWIDHIWIFDTLFTPPDAFCMSLYCQKEKWAILTPSTLPYPFECLNPQAQCLRTCHCVSFTSQNIPELLLLLLMLSWIKHTLKMRNTAKSDICLTFPSLSGIRKITKKCQKIPTYYLQMIQVNGKSYLLMADTYVPEYRLDRKSVV